MGNASYLNNRFPTAMKRYILTAIAIILLASAASAQGKVPKYDRHNRWMTSISFTKDNRNSLGFGVRGIYGRQFSKVIFLGVGFGTDVTFENTSGLSVSYTDGNGNETVREYAPYNHHFLFPVYADLMVDFTRGASPFFAEFKVGGAFDSTLTRIRGSESYNTFDFGGCGVLLGSGVGKHFRLKNNDTIDVMLSIDCILGPFYTNVPVSIGLRYGF